MNKMPHFEDMRFGLRIDVGFGNDRKCYRMWKDMTFQYLQRWQWYMEYRAALYKVQNPKVKVEIEQFRCAYTPPEELIAKRERDKRIACKAKLTQYTNLKKQQLKHLSELKTQWSQLFPIEDSSLWLSEMAYLRKIEAKIAEKTLQLNTTHL